MSSECMTFSFAKLLLLSGGIIALHTSAMALDISAMGFVSDSCSSIPVTNALLFICLYKENYTLFVFVQCHEIYEYHEFGQNKVEKRLTSKAIENSQRNK